MKKILLFLLLSSSMLMTSCKEDFVFDPVAWDMEGSMWESKNDDDLMLVFDSDRTTRCYFQDEACGWGTYTKNGLNVTIDMSALASYKILRFDTATLSSDGETLNVRVTTVSYPTDEVEYHTFTRYTPYY